MPGVGEVGKKHEDKVKEWLDRPKDGYSFDRIPDQMTGFYGSKNICDFICFKAPYLTYIECKATYEDRFDFSMLTDTQHDGLLDKSRIQNVFGVVAVLFATSKRAFLIDIREIKRLEDLGKKSINIKKIDKWELKYHEIATEPSNRKKYLDYLGDLEQYLPFDTEVDESIYNGLDERLKHPGKKAEPKQECIASLEEEGGFSSPPF